MVIKKIKNEYDVQCPCCGSWNLRENWYYVNPSDFICEDCGWFGNR